MDNTFTTGLYIFSSFIQADAAILGLGAVFVIYRLQSLYSQEQLHIYILDTSQIDTVKEAIKTVIKGDPQRIDEKLREFESNHPSYLPSLRFLSEKDRHVAAAKTGFIPSLILVAVHCILSAACLWLMSFVCVSPVDRFVQIVGAIVTILFGAILLEVVTACQVALDIKPFIRSFPLGKRIWSKAEIKSQNGAAKS
jgi:hypothetical protein